MIDSKMELGDLLIEADETNQTSHIINGDRGEYEPINESWAAYLEMREKGISYRELSEIEMEIEAVRTIDDKRYINYRIQDDIATVNRFIEKIKKNDSNFMVAKGIEAEDLKKYQNFLQELYKLNAMLKKRRPRGKEYGIIHEI